MTKLLRTIVHEIPQGKYSPNGNGQVRLSDALTELMPATRRFVEENMLDFSLRSPRMIVEDDQSDSNTPDVVRGLFDAEDEAFIEGSKILAQSLFQAQTGGSPAGILIVAEAHRGPQKVLVVMKAEHQEGMQLKQVNTGGLSHFDLEHLDELIIGNNSKVYKIAVLEKSHDGIFGEMVDQQNGVGFASFFLVNFLGCKLLENAEIQTKDFTDAALKFVNDEHLHPVKRARYATALIAYIQSPEETIVPDEFADRFLDPEDRDEFVSRLPETVAGREISKDTRLIPGQGGALRFYGNGIVVSASAEALERGALEVLSEEEGATVIRLTEPVRRLGLVSAPRGVAR